MLYQEYQQKIEKIAKIRKFLFRYRVLFILLTAAILSLSITLMALSGTVNDTTCPSSFIYGEGISYSADAMMQDVYYEYSLDGGATWTTTPPSEIGVYQVRAVSHGLFGSKRTGKAHEFKILPQPINVVVNENSVVYGDNPTVSANLKYEDTITCSSFIFEDSTKASTTVTPDKNSIVITNKDGEDVTTSYDINIVSSVVRLDKRFLTITVSNKEAIYSAVALTYDGYQITNGSLALENGFKDTIQAEFTKSQTNVGSIKNEPIIHIYNKNGVEVSDRYQLNIVVGELIVKPKQILITTGAYDEYYDGKSHTCQSYTIDSETQLIDGHSLIVTKATDVKDVTKEEIDNVLLFTVLNEEGKDISENYNLIVSYSKLNVKPRPITIQSATTSFVYDDSIHYDKKTTVVSELKLVNDDVINTFSYTKIKDVSEGYISNEIGCQIYTKDGKDNTSNYSITYDFGKLNVTRREVKILTESNLWTYDGNAHSEIKYKVISKNDFVKTHTVIFDGEMPTITDVGDKLNIFAIHVENENGENVSNENYSISYQYGTLSIKARNINVKTPTDSKPYDGEPLIRDEVDKFEITGDGLAPGQTIKVLSNTSMTNVKFDSDGITVVSDKNIITFEILDKNGNKVLDSNYSIKTEYGALTIELRNLSVTSQNKTFTYNDEEFSYTDFDYGNGTSLAPKQTAEIDTSKPIATIKEVKESGKDNAFEIIIKDANNNLTTKNYKITYQLGKLYMDQRKITIVAGSDKKTYDATALTCNEIVLPLGKVDGHVINCTIEGSQTDAGSSSNIIKDGSVSISNTSGEVTENYSITLKEGTLLVNPRPIEITTHTNTSFIYDDKYYYDIDIKNKDGNIDILTGGTLVDSSFNHRIEVDTSKEYTKVIEVQDPVENKYEIKILGGDNSPKTLNYEITYKYGKLAVQPKQISISTKDRSFTYDGYEHSYCEENIGFTYNTLVEGHEISSIIGKKVQFVSSTTVFNEVTLKIKRTADNADTTKNYSFSYSSKGELTINPLAVTITCQNDKKPYDGTQLTGTYTNSSIATTDTISSLVLPSITNCSESGKPNTIDPKEIVICAKDDSSDIRTGNYEFTIVPGELTIDLRPLKVNVKNKSFVYNDEDFTFTDFNYLDDTSLAPNQTAEIDTSKPIATIKEVKESGKTNAFEIIIKDANNNSTTKNYDITYTFGTLKVTERPISIKPIDKSKMYNGEALTLTDNEHEITNATNNYEGLVSGHILTTKISGTITNAGSKEVTISSYDITNNIGSVKDNYIVTVSIGTLTINKLEITITTSDLEKEYNGKLWSNDEYTITAGEFVSGHKLKDYSYTEEKNVKYDADNKVTYYENVFSDAKVKDDDGNDYTSNYQITYINGHITINPKQLTITAGTTSRTYNGTTLTYDNYSQEGLITDPTHTLTVTISGSLLNAGTIQNIPSNASIMENGDPVTSNYNITYVNGLLTVTKRALTLTTSNSDKVYDGTPLVGTYTVDKDTDYTGEDKDNKGLVTKYDEILPSNVTYTQLDDIGRIENVITISITQNHDPFDDVTSNYDITTINGDLLIKREITIKVNDLTVEYNGQEQGHTSNNQYSITSTYGLAPDNFIKEELLEFTGKQTAINTYTDTLGLNKDSIKIVKTIIEDEIEKEVDLTEFYIITIDLGDLTITKREIVITTQSHEFDYDGEDHGYCELNNGYIINSGSLLNGHSLSVNTYATIRNYSDEGVINVITFTISMEGDFNDFYNITVNNNGILTIKKRTINVTSKSINTIYDGTIHEGDDFTIDPSTPIVSGQTATIKTYTSIQDVEYDTEGNVTSKKNIITIQIKDASENDLTYNYSIIYIVGTLELTPKEITITSDSKGPVVYDGTSLVGKLVSITDLATGDYYDLTFTTLDHVGKVANALTAQEFYRLGEADVHVDVTKNYKFEYVYGYLEITPRQITFTISSGEWTYDGEEHSLQDYVLEEATSTTGLLSDHEIIVTDYAKIRNANADKDGTLIGEAVYNFITPTIVLTSDKTVDLTSNYAITINDNATLKVKKAELIIKLKNAEFEYDGGYHESTLNTVSGKAESDYISITTDASEIYPGTYPNNIKDVSITSPQYGDSKANYDITLLSGTIKINPRAITIKTNDHHETYEENKTYSYENDYTIENGSILSGQVLKITTISVTGKHEDGVENKIVSLYIVDENNSAKSYKEYYDITTIHGKIYIGNPYIKIESEGIKQYCDIVDEQGGTLTNSSFKVNGVSFNGTTEIEISNLNISALQSTHLLVVQITGAVSTSDASYSSNNTIVWKIVNADNKSTIVQDDSTVKENQVYDIDIVEGLLQIELRTIYITTGGGEWTYDGQPHSNDEVTVDTSLVKEGHTFSYDTPSKTITNVGRVFNDVDYRFSGLTAELAKKYYKVETNWGELVINGIPVIIRSASDGKVYDGTALTNSRVDVLYDAKLVSGHVILDSIKTAATGSNTGQEDKTTSVDNTIDITKFIVGLPHTYSDTVIYYTSSGENTYSQTDVTSSTFDDLVASGLYIKLDDLYIRLIKYNDLYYADVTSFYKLTQQLGKLTVYAKEDDIDDDETSPVITILSTKEGLVYLRTVAYGEYVKSGATPFNEADVSTNYITIGGTNYSADYIAGLILKENGIKLATATISSYINNYGIKGYPLPYYLNKDTGTYQKQQSDVFYTGDSSSAYTVGYYSISIEDLQAILNNSSIKLTGDLATQEDAYYAEISASDSQYMQIDDETKAYMNKIIVDNDFDNPNLSTYQRITSIASFIQKSAVYSLSYNSNLDSEQNVAVAFLDTYKCGVCRHYATAATMLYRALNIPARLVIGFVGNIADENTPIDITIASYHAWVEVYIKGYGWIQVEVTGANANGQQMFGGYSSDGEVPSLTGLTITVRPVLVDEIYDGHIHQPDAFEIVADDTTISVEALIAEGYSFTYEMNGSGFAPGEYSSSIINGTFHVIKDDVDITQYCTIKYETNAIVIHKRPIEITSLNRQWQYDGNEHSPDSDAYSISNDKIADCDREYISFISSITNVGFKDSDFNYYILDANNNDVTSYYEVTKTLGELRITPVLIYIITDSDSKYYDGTALTKNSYTIRTGAFINGHELQITINGSQTEPGKSDNTYDINSVKVIDTLNGNADVSDLYSITIELGTLEIKSRTIIINTGSANKKYDGTPLTHLVGDANTYTYNEEVLEEGHTLYVTLTGETSGSDVQIVDNTCKAVVKDNNGNIIDEYEFEYHYGKLSIQPKLIYVTTGSKSIDYDGGKTKLYCDEYSYTKSTLISGHEIYTAENWAFIEKIPDGASLIDVSVDSGAKRKAYTITNTAEFIIIDTNDNNRIVTQNYEVDPEKFGRLTVVKRNIIVTTGNVSKEYDGEPLKDTTITIDDSQLYSGHQIVATPIQVIADPSSIENAYTIQVIDTNNENEDVTEIYNIITSFGTLEITKRHITIKTGSASKYYDGIPLVCDEWQLTHGSLLDGHHLVVNVTGKAEEKTSEKNTASCYVYKDTDTEENRLDDYYDIFVNTGDLTIILREIVITSKSSTKPYDGTPLTYNDKNQITVTGLENLDTENGHTLNYYIDDSVSQTLVGVRENTVTYSVTDKDGHDVSSLYYFNSNFGNLIVTKAKITIKTGSKKSSDTSSPLSYDNYTIVSGKFYDEYVISLTGQQIGVGSSDNTYEINFTDEKYKDCYDINNQLGILTVYDPANITVYAQLYAEKDGSIFLKEKSYGDYTKTSWADANDYSVLLDDTYSMSYLPSITLKNQAQENSSRILSIYDYALPEYISMNDTNIQTSDVESEGNGNLEYNIKYYVFDPVDYATLSFGLGDYSTLETAYRAYVNENYMSYPDSTASVINANMNFSSLNSGSATYYLDIAELIKKIGVNYASYNTAIDSSTDIVAAFVNYKKGVSKHFASLATIVYRMLGIPARYCEGAYGEIQKPNTWTDIPMSNRISYVEVYAPNFGWIPINVTPTATDNPGEDPIIEEKTPITLTPKMVEKAYDGTPLYAVDELEVPVKELLGDSKYTSAVTVTGSRTTKGESESTITSYKIFYDGVDVTSKFDVTLNKGQIRVTNVQIEVKLYEYSFEYDGTNHSYSTSQKVYWSTSFPSGFTKSNYVLLFDKSKLSIKYVGSIAYDDLRNAATLLEIASTYESDTQYYDATGALIDSINNETEFNAYTDPKYKNVTSSFYLKFEGKGLIVQKRSITVTSATASKEYDGSTLTAETASISLGSLAPGYSTGDRIEVTVTGSISKKGTVDNTIEDIVIKNEDGDDVTNCYEITIVLGKLTLT